MTGPRTLFEKIWADHVVRDFGDDTYLLHVDRSFQHELAAMTFDGLRKARRRVLCPDLTFATVDHLLDTFPGRTDETLIPNGADFIRTLRAGAKAAGVTFFDRDDPRQGIIHVIAPDLGIVLPGMIFVCGDSHTSTLGGVGALAWGIGSSDIEHVMATQTILQTKPMTMRVDFDGPRSPGVTAKDLVLHLIGRISADGGNGYAIEYAGSAAPGLSVEERLTICNMSIELSARSGMFAPDEAVYQHLADAPFSPKGVAWDQALAYWRKLPSDEGAAFDRTVRIDCAGLTPQVTWGASPEHVIGIAERAPDPAAASTARERASQERALAYMGLKPGDALAGLPIDAAFIGSCTNSRLSDLRAAAGVLKGRKVAEGVKAICTPGSQAVKRNAEAEGIDRIFKDAGFEWREPGCSLCMSGGAGGEAFPERARVITSTNRNFEHRQGRDVRSHLASPETVAASAVAGRIAAATGAF